MKDHLIELAYAFPETILSYFKQQGSVLTGILKDMDWKDKEVVAKVQQKVSNLLFLYKEILFSFTPALHQLLIQLACEAFGELTETSLHLCYQILKIIELGSPQKAYVPKIQNLLLRASEKYGAKKGVEDAEKL